MSSTLLHALLTLSVALLGVVGQAAQPMTALAASPYVDTVLSDRPTVYWRFDETSGGTAADASGNGHSGLLYGVWGGFGGAIARDSNTAFYFNGSAFIQDTNAINVGPDFTMEAWIKAASTTVSAPVVSLTAPGGGPASRTIYLDGNRFLGMADMSGNWPAYTVWSMPVDPTVWHHVVFTTQGGITLQIYVDGALSGSNAVAPRPAFYGNPIVGWSTAVWLRHFTGTVDEVAMYPTALTGQRVSAHYSVATSTAAAAPACPDTLQSLVDAAAPGATVSVPACVFRETVTISKPLTLAGQPGAEMRGSDVWSSWTAQGGAWLSSRSVPTLPVVSLDPTACDPGVPNRCLWPEQVFFDGRALDPVAAGSLPGAGQFALVSSTDRHVRLGDNPSGHTVEVTTRPRWIVTAADNVTIQGMTMQHAASSAVAGAISNDGHSNWTLQDSTVSDAHAAIVELQGGANIKVLRNDIARGGLAGINGANITSGGLIQANKIHDNSRNSFNQNWGAGGLKLTVVSNFIVDGNDAHHNNGVGLWCDIGCSNVTMSNNRVHHNQWQGINFEISNGASIHDNALWENGWGKAAWGWGAGIVISSSANAEVFRNTVAWNYAGISVISQNRADAVNPVGNYVHDNVIVKKTVTGDFSQTYWQNLSLAWLSDGSKPMFDAAWNNHALNNRVWYDLPENLSVRFSWTTQYLTLAAFAPLPGGTGTTYMATSDMNAALNAASMPLSAEAH